MGARANRRRSGGVGRKTSCRSRCAPRCRRSRPSWTRSPCCAPITPAPTGRGACSSASPTAARSKRCCCRAAACACRAQVGCAVGCVFCMTGRGGLERQLGSAEIVAQVALARRLRPVTKVVFMGMGEPAHNLDAVLEAIDLLGTGGGIGHKQLVFSTVGDRARLRAPAAGPRQAGARALAAQHRRRRCARGCCRARRASRPTSWSRSATPTRARPATRCSSSGRCSTASTTAPTRSTGWLACSPARYAVLNLIPYNAVDGLAFARPDAERSRAIARELHRRGVLTKLRQSAGQDVEAAAGSCGRGMSAARGA